MAAVRERNPIIRSRGKVKEWVETLKQNRFDKSFLTPRLLLSDPELSTFIGFEQAFIDSVRNNGSWITIVPIGKQGWSFWSYVTGKIRTSRL